MAFWVREGVVLAGMAVNTWNQGEAVQALVRSGVAVDAARLADPNVALAELLDTNPSER
jgi:3-phenylpropionate/trans-cinnamate dioxygenase ferredoxin reductase subunit